ncbi:MAG: hypothetical protein Q3M24_06430 [Candidatus Electrothrix aestuarii]|uniref:Uncharacterized protein n=1 Tax=Candidatus Electrothrix aestuarii TaxID=3062594 RepID=A0AAU8LZP1_9BACT|nr:hypothetical protein [Candidatus Electrothrix aestuarii]
MLNQEDQCQNKLKSVDTCTLEKTIAKAIGDLTGINNYTCFIDNIKYSFPEGGKFDVSLGDLSHLTE